MAAYNYYGQNFTNPYGAWNYPQGFQPIQPQAVQGVPQMAPQSQQMQGYSPVANSSGIIWVSGAQEAQMYPIAPNNAVALWEKSGKVIYLKQADATGKPTMTVFDLVERKDGISEQSGQDGNTPPYATKDELSTIVGAVKGLASEVEQMKGDLYGAVGRKKPTVKKGDGEDDA